MVVFPFWVLRSTARGTQSFKNLQSETFKSVSISEPSGAFKAAQLPTSSSTFQVIYSQPEIPSGDSEVTRDIKQ